MSACAQRETKRKNIFFLPQWLPVVLLPMEAKPLGNSPVMSLKKKKYFFLFFSLRRTRS